MLGYPFKSNLDLSPFTSLGLGGKASFFFCAKSLDELCQALGNAQSQGLSVLILGGGSNLIIPDEGFDGLVIKIELRGRDIQEEGDTVRLGIAAGENWDSFVKKCVDGALGGVECLSGIPGLIGASPIQNIGAYGQEVSQSIESVECLDRKNLELHTLKPSQCAFAYRSSIFKQEQRNRFVITQVNYILRKNYVPEITYGELKNYMQNTALEKTKNIKECLQLIRNAVLALRRSKGMLLDPQDPESRSAGSFFINPILTLKQYEQLEARCKALASPAKIPSYPLGEEGKVKVSAAWLVERSGFGRGFRREGEGVGVSKKHSLALVNYNRGTTRELLALASQIQTKVEELYGIHLEREPVWVQPDS